MDVKKIQLKPEVQKDLMTNLDVIDESLPWVLARNDYSYLENGVLEANQYLENHKLTLEDLRNFHDIGNVLFGDYLSKIMLDFEHRTLSWIDDDLFVNEHCRNNLYGFLIEDFHEEKIRYSKDVLRKSPNIRIMTNHMGDRNEWIFVPIRVYFSAPKGFENDPTFDENSGTDTRWRYYVLQMKKDSGSPYGWKIAFEGQVVSRGLDGEILKEAWFVCLNLNDDFSKEGWGDVMRVMGVLGNILLVILIVGTKNSVIQV